MTDRNRDTETAEELCGRFEEVYLHRGHVQWMAHAMRLEDYYLAGGRQWKADDRDEMENGDNPRPAFEVDVVKPAVNAIIGYQIANRVDPAFVPRGGEADEQSAKLISKVVRQVLDNANWRFRETDACLDGLIQQRGYIDVRMDYEGNDLGEIALRVVDPLDGIPDPDATDYDPDHWQDWHEARWMTASQIEGEYGIDVANEVKARSREARADKPLGDEHGITRQGFGQRANLMNTYGYGYYGEDGPWRRYRLVHRQANEYVNTLVARWPTGDLTPVEGQPREYIAWLLDQGIPVFKRRMRRCRMQVIAPDVLIRDEPSPYSHITAVPFFPYFRRGRTVGVVDSMTSVQDMLNKFVSQFAHIVNTTANSGWQGEAGVLRNMSDDDLADNGGATGLLLLREPGTKPFEKIQPNQIPTGVDRMVEFAYKNAQIVSGVDENMLGLQKDLSGVAVQSLQYAAQQKLAIILNNLSRTRRMVLERTLEMVQRYMGAERVVRIAEDDAFGVSRRVPYVINERQPDGGPILNDVTVGTYDLVLSEQPAQVTFDNSQFEQMKTMRTEMGIAIPDARVIRSSNLTDKSEIAEEMQQQAQETNPVAEAEAALKRAQARKVESEAINKAVEAQFSAVKTAREIVLTPQAAMLAESLLLSAGYKDADAAPIVPEAPQDVAGFDAPPSANHESSNPLTPPNPTAGLDAGMTATDA